MNIKKKLYSFILLILLTGYLLTTAQPIFAEGTYASIGTGTAADAGGDAVTWSQGYPIMVDSYGNYIVPAQRDTGGLYYWQYSNNKGSSWSEIAATNLSLRPSAVYDPINDKIHVLIAGTTGVRYRRYIIRRDKNYDIQNIVEETSATIPFEQVGSCTGYDAKNPILLFKNSGSNGTLAAFWSVKKTCSGSTITETRATMRILSNTSADATASNWKALNGTSDASGAVGPADIDYNRLYSYSGSDTPFQHSAMIRGGSGSKSSDIYYFNIDENDTHGFRRLAWNSTDWSGSWTSRTTFGGDILDSSGYSLKKELLTKPIYDSAHDKVFVGIARYISSGSLGDTQSVYEVNSSDSVSLTSNVYSAGTSATYPANTSDTSNTALYPTLDISYDSNTEKLYVFYVTANDGTYGKGHVYYKTYDGSSFSSATAFYTPSGETADIPIVYQSRDYDRMILFFRKNKTSNPNLPPHDIYFGYVTLNATAGSSVSASSSPYTATNFTDFRQLCTEQSSTQVTNINGGEVALTSSYHDSFETPISPYIGPFYDIWHTGVWSDGTYNPSPSGSISIQKLATSGTQGTFIVGSTANTVNKKIIEFRAKFTSSSNSQHIGWTDSDGDEPQFNTFIMFSTMSNGQLNTRVNGTSSALTSSYLDAFHTYKITWATNDIKFYIDNVQVGSTYTDNVTTNLVPVMSNDSRSGGQDLLVDWITVSNYPNTSGTYQSCAIDSGGADTTWNTITYNTSTPGSTSLNVKTRTSSDNITWSAWSSTITSGGTISSSPARYIQFLTTLSGSSTETSSLNNLSMTFASPTPSPTPTASPTPTPTNTPTPTTVSSSSGSNNTLPHGEPRPQPPQCNDEKPGSKAPQLLMAVPQSTNSIKLYIADGDKPIDKYVLTFGTKSGEYQYGAPDIGGYGIGSYTVGGLAPNTTYYFKIRSGNGCAVGGWSNELSAKTHSAFQSKQTVVTNVEIKATDDEPKVESKKVDVCKPYTVQSKDSLWSIAKKQLNDATATDNIIELNKKTYPSIENGDLQIGWELTLKDCTNEKDEVKSESDNNKSQTYNLKLQLVDDKKQPLKNVDVTLHSTPRKGKTNDQGVVEFTNVEGGDHKLFIAQNNAVAEQSLNLSGDKENIEMNIELKQTNIWLNWQVLTVITILLAIIGFLLMRNRTIKVGVHR